MRNQFQQDGFSGAGAWSVPQLGRTREAREGVGVVVYEGVR